MQIEITHALAGEYISRIRMKPYCKITFLLNTCTVAATLLVTACQTSGPPPDPDRQASTPAPGTPIPASPKAVVNAAPPRNLPLRNGFTCCNLHYEGNWISDANWTALPFIPAGTPIRITAYERNRILAEIGERPVRIGLDYGRNRIGLDKLGAQIVVTTDPKAALATWPTPVQQAIREGKLVLGMTREQAIMAVGYPQADHTTSINAPIWNHWASSFGQYRLHWGKDGHLAKVESDPGTLARVLLK